jgi:hypothetical protein
MKSLQQYSRRLFGRTHALDVYCAIAALPERFTSTQVRALSGAPQPEISKELKVLIELDLLDGSLNNYKRIESPFWMACQIIAGSWGMDSLLGAGLGTLPSSERSSLG